MSCRYRLFAGLFLLLVLPFAPAHGQRQMEKLGRGVVAIRNSTSSTSTVYVGWRLLGNDPEDIAFNVYRSANGAAAVKITAAPITATTNYVDTPPNINTTEYVYSVRPWLNNTEVADAWANPASGTFKLQALRANTTAAQQYIPVPLQPTPDDAAAGVSYDVKFCWVGDFDGDGEYDFLVDRSNPSVEAKQWLQAYKRDGTLLWQIDMGPNSVNHYNITPGSSTIGIGHGDNVTVYDIDGDGKAEVLLRTAKGVVFPNGTVLTPEAPYASTDNEVQYISILEGMTGLEKIQTSGANAGKPARAVVPIPAGWVTKTHVQGQMGIVYADGVRPSLFFHPSNRNPDESFNKFAVTWDYRNGALTQRWVWLPAGHTAEGHQIRFADVDNDGKDEYVDVGNVVKSDGSGQINEPVLTEVVHGDRFHVADIDPDRPGLETYLIQQNNSTGLANAYHSSDKSAVIKKWYAAGVVDVGRGTIGAFVPSVKGLEMFSTFGGTFDCKGNQLYSGAPFPPETIWWDGDLGREFLSTIGSSATSPGIDKFNTANGDTSRVLSLYSDTAAPNSPYNNYIAYGGRPQFWGDILGDWREEMICVAQDNSELRIYTTRTVDPGNASGGVPFRIYTLMHNPQYRIQATTKGYVQSSYVDYYLGYGMTPPPPPPMVDAKLVWQGGAGTTTWDAGVTPSWRNNGASSTYADGDTVRFDISGDNTSAVNLAGTLQPGALTVYNPKDYAFTGSGTFAGAMKLTKAGAGSLVLPNTHAFTGRTTVWDGALVVNGTLQNSPVSVWGGAWGGALAAGKTGGRLAGVGQFSQPVKIRYRGAITPGAGMNSPGTLTFAGGLATEDGATFALDLSDDPTGTTKPNDRIAVLGNLTLAGTTSIVINPLNASLGAGTYTLATYTGTLTGSLSNLAAVVPVGTPYTLAVGSGVIQLIVPTTRAAATVQWRGSGANWDLAASQNWLRAGSPDVFVSGDSVTFDASGAAAATATLATALPISGVTVNSDSGYTFSGGGSLTGSGGLTKSGAGTLTINTINSYTGPTVINGGVVAVSALGDAGSPSALGSSTSAASNFVLNGGALRLTGSQTNSDRNVTLGTSGATFDITSASSSIQLSGVLSGGGSLTKSGAGTLLLAGANTYAGGTTINGGAIYLAGSVANRNGLGAGNVTINSGVLSMADVQNNDVANWNLIVPAGSTAKLIADGRCSLNGSLTGGGDFTFYSPYVRTDLKGNWSAFTGRINVADGEMRLTNSYGFANAAMNLGAGSTGGYVYYNLTMGSNLTLGIGELAGTAASSLMGGPTAGRTLTWQIGARNTDSTFAGIVKDGTGATALTKVGAGALTLAGANTYTGATTVSAGKLALRGGSLAGTNVTVASGAGFGGNGSVTGNVNFSANSLFLANPAAGPLAVTGNLTFGGSVTVVAAPGAVLSAGTFALYTYTGVLTGTPTFSWSGSGYNATFDTSTAGQVKISLVELPRDPTDIVWTGGIDAPWDTSSLNWIWSGGGTRFQTDDRVRFDDTSAGASVILSSSVAPASVTVDSIRDYTLSGAGSITGSASLTKSGPGNLTFSLSSAQTFSGGSTINAGTVTLGSATDLGSGPVTLAGGVLATGALAPANAIVVTAESRITGGGGGGSSHGIRAISGAGALTLEATNGNFDLEGSLSGFSGTILFTGTGSFRLLNVGGSVTADFDLGTSAVNTRSGSAISLGSLSGAAGSTLSNNTSNGSNPATVTVGANGKNTTFAGVISNAGSGAGLRRIALTKTGPGALALSGASTYTGATTVGAGSLLVGGSLGATAVSVSSGATIGGAGALGGGLTLASGAKLALAVGPSVTKGLTVSGSTVLNGAITVVPAFVGGTLNPGTYTLLTYSGALGGSPTFAWSDPSASGYVAAFDTATAGQVKMTLVAPPVAPSGLFATSGNAQTVLSWNAVANAASYTVLRSTASGSGYVAIASGLTANNYVNGGLTNGALYYYVVTATNLAGTSGNSNEASARPGQSYSQFAAAAFPGQTDPTIVGLAADPDNDGYNNLLEYFMSTPPNAANGSNLITSALDDQGRVVLTFPMSKNLSDVSYTVQQSADMNTWTGANVTPTMARDEGAYYLMNAAVPRGANNKLFLRLNVTAP